jgi:hypothetical protein
MSTTPLRLESWRSSACRARAFFVGGVSIPTFRQSLAIAMSMPRLRWTTRRNQHGAGSDGHGERHRPSSFALGVPALLFVLERLGTACQLKQTARSSGVFSRECAADGPLTSSRSSSPRAIEDISTPRRHRLLVRVNAIGRTGFGRRSPTQPRHSRTSSQRVTASPTVSPYAAPTEPHFKGFLPPTSPSRSHSPQSFGSKMADWSKSGAVSISSICGNSFRQRPRQA